MSKIFLKNRSQSTNISWNYKPNDHELLLYKFIQTFLEKSPKKMNNILKSQKPCTQNRN